MDNFFPDEVKEAADKIGGEFIKAEEFKAGLTLQLVKPLEKIVSRYGATEADFLAKNEILEVGQSFRYTFKTTDGEERKLDSKSAPFFLAFKQCEELGVGDWVHIERTGKTKDDTRYTVVKTDEPKATNGPKATNE